jgi:glycosyltransferase involved in cell wall biosynthesis
MRVIHVISGDLWAGAAVQVYHTLVDLNQRRGRWQGSAVLFNPGILEDRLSSAEVQSFLVDESELGPIQMIRRMAGVFADTDPQIIHVHSYKEHILGFLASRMSGVDAAFVRTFHGRRETPKAQGLARRLRSEATYAAERFLMARASIVAVSKDLEKLLREAFPRADVRQIYNGVLLPTQGGTDREALRAQFGIPEEDCWIATAARLERVKNLPLLLDAALILKEDGPPGFTISVFGDGPERPTLEDRCRQHGLEKWVRFHGFQDPMAPVLGAVDVFTLSSFHEGLPMALVEAMACGAVPVCTEVGGVLEVLAHGHDGLLVPSGDAEAFAGALRQLVEDVRMRRTMAQNARRTVSDHFEIGKNNDALIDFYESVLGVGARIGGEGLAN